MTEMNKYSQEALRLLLEQARQDREPQQILDVIPYSSFIGVKAKIEDNRILYFMPEQHSNIGNPSLPAIHGGVIGGFMELSAAVELLYTLNIEKIPKVADFSLDYLRPGRFQTTYASCSVLRHGKKLVNVSVLAWQDSPDKPIATARCHFLVS
jgi:acyl-coenzyme A thioesterase PaaI-like protein